jgi:hypothetical protein
MVFNVLENDRYFGEASAQHGLIWLPPQSE